MLKWVLMKMVMFLGVLVGVVLVCVGFMWFSVSELIVLMVVVSSSEVMVSGVCFSGKIFMGRFCKQEYGSIGLVIIVLIVYYV